ncbi:MAG: glycosidase [Planctomycetes bacterium]|nr:glycosidase [Planctomycetota bacterium]
MDKTAWDEKLGELKARHEELLTQKNTIDTTWVNGLFDRYENPVVTNNHAPIEWRYDLDYSRNPFLLERQGINATLNPGAIIYEGKVVLCVRTEGNDRKSFFSMAESENGIDGFRFWDKPVVIPETDNPDTNVYDMRLVKHEDGWIYGIFCTERPDPKRAPGDLSSAVAQCGVVRSKDMRDWERLADIKTGAPQQRNVVLHPEFIDGKYALYTRPQDDFIEAGSGGGIGWGLADSMENAVVDSDCIIDFKAYHTIKELKNGLGPAPIKTDKGWLQMAHGVRGCAAGMRYVLYAFMTALDDPSRVIAAPGGHLMAPRRLERVGDVSNVLFCNGWVQKPDGTILIYYASSDTRIHVASTTAEKMVDYVLNTPTDGGRSYACVQQRLELIERNKKC